MIWRRHQRFLNEKNEKEQKKVEKKSIGAIISHNNNLMYYIYMQYDTSQQYIICGLFFSRFSVGGVDRNVCHELERGPERVFQGSLRQLLLARKEAQQLQPRPLLSRFALEHSIQYHLRHCLGDGPLVREFVEGLRIEEPEPEAEIELEGKRVS